MELKFKKLADEAIIPEYKTSGSSGMDVSSLISATLFPGQTAMLPTGLAVEIPENYELQCRSRSGHAKQGLIVTNSPGTIDADYRGEINILLTNLNDTGSMRIEIGDRIAQLVLAEVTKADIVVIDELSETSRGKGGFGSTGVKNG